MTVRLAMLAMAVLVAAAPGPARASGCPERPMCQGCGCRGGPGYRAPDGRCVGFRDLDRVCGGGDHPRCTFENAPNTGLNRECALRDAHPRNGS